MVKTTQNRSSYQSATPSELLHAIAHHHDRDAFHVLFQFYAPRLKQFFMKSGADAANAEDLVQETLVSVWKSAHQYDAKVASVATWVFVIARRRRADWLRKQRRTPPTSLSVDALEEAMLFDGDAGLSREEQEAMVAALKDLPAEQFQVIYASFFEGKTHDDIARRQRIPLGTVKSRIRLAFDKMRRTLVDKKDSER